MNSLQEYKLKRLKEQDEILKRGTWNDIDKLEYLLAEIRLNPYGLSWRSGMIKALRHAIKLLKEEKKNENAYL